MWDSAFNEQTSTYQWYSTIFDPNHWTWRNTGSRENGERPCVPAKGYRYFKILAHTGWFWVPALKDLTNQRCITVTVSVDDDGWIYINGKYFYSWPSNDVLTITYDFLEYGKWNRYTMFGVDNCIYGNVQINKIALGAFL